ncbi:CAAX protease self-immunity [Geodermatophilus siccatus]|uniref:CAAX protease self-immunity n=1 Tax=Geodermatophilus siccatus TaxID=1137991 RepID=A0A1G9TIB9_9ACTN|nr:type II CAAX endopeptidase family protein [Geodermatophilus siccatus]SDM46865.1 CAAX protease self-immunity [Geodermatophilus siccatus]
MSATDARRPVPTAAGGLRGRVARRPLTAFLVLVAVVGWPLMSLPALTTHGVLPGGPLPQEPFALGTTLLVMLPAALWVTAVADGRSAVRVLLRRAVQWRFGAGWWAAVLLALPVLTLAVGVAAGQGLQTGDLLATLASGALSVVAAVLLVHLWEETVWAGFFQGRLERRHGFLAAAALTAVPFAAVHLPLAFIGDLTPGGVGLAAGGLLVLGVLMRLLVGATVRGAAGSLLAAGIVHATFNASNNEGNLVDDLLAGGQPTLYAVVAAVLFTAGALLAVRGRR